MTYKVLIAEDETPILHNLVQKINSLHLPVTVIGTAADGEEALEIMAREQPHILLTDVRMPGMDGLALCCRVDEQYPQMKKIIISGYGEFEYAQKAMQYHVSDYLLKPVNLIQLKEVMQALCADLQEETFTQEYQILAQNLASGSCEPTLPCQFDDKEFGIYLICLGNLLEHTFASTDPAFFAALWKQADLDSFLQKNFTSAERWWSVAEKCPNERILVVSSFQKGKDGFEAALQSHLESRLSAYISTTVCGSDKGVPFQDIWETAQLLRQLLHSRLIPCTPCILTPSTTAVFSETVADAAQQLVLRAIRNRQYPMFETALEHYFSVLKEQQAPQQLLESIVVMLIKKLIECADNADVPPKNVYPQLYQLIAEQKSITVLYQMLTERLCDLFSALFPVCNSGEELAVMVRNYLEENYREDISVETLSDVFHFSVSYIGRVFRVQFDVPPVKYLLQLRMEKAKQLIRENSDVNLTLISEMVGFSDSHYFSRIFRSIVGITPSEYKKQVLPHFDSV